MNPYIIKQAMGVSLGGAAAANPVAAAATEAASGKAAKTFGQKFLAALKSSGKRGLFGALVGGGLVGAGSLLGAARDTIGRNMAVNSATKDYPALSGMSKAEIARVAKTLSRYSPAAARDPAMLAYMAPRLRAMDGAIDPAMAATLARLHKDSDSSGPLKTELAKGIAGGAMKGMFLPDFKDM